MATINTARCYGLKELGAVAPGYQADLIVTDDLSSFRILSVYHKGRLIDPSVRPETAACPDSLKNTVHVRPLSSDAFRLSITKEEVPVIRLNASQITTSKIACHLPKTDNYLPQDGFNKIAAVERHKATGKTGVGICTGYNIRNGAIASSVSHDSHNIIVIGDNDTDMLLAVSEIIRVQGGYTLVSRGKVLGTLPLPVMGLMSDAGFETVNRTLGQMIAEAGGFISANVLSSVSGTVKAIEPRMQVNGFPVMSIVVESDGRFEPVEGTGVKRDIDALSKEEIRELVFRGMTPEEVMLFRRLLIQINTNLE